MSKTFGENCGDNCDGLEKQKRVCLRYNQRKIGLGSKIYLGRPDLKLDKTANKFKRCDQCLRENN